MLACTDRAGSHDELRDFLFKTLLSDRLIQVEDNTKRLLGLSKGWLNGGDRAIEVKITVIKGKQIRDFDNRRSFNTGWPLIKVPLNTGRLYLKTLYWKLLSYHPLKWYRMQKGTRRQRSSAFCILELVCSQQNVLFHLMLKNFNSIIHFISNFLSFLFWNNLPIQNTVLIRSLNDMPTN